MGVAVGGLAVGLLFGALVCLAVVAAFENGRIARSAHDHGGSDDSAIAEQVFQLGIDNKHIIEELDYLRRRIDQLQAEDTITLAEYHGVPRHDDECS
ncbi:MAG: hypothetical protein OXE46_15170 [Chloroflexi bacterium]|nr:hypothetical protein [Chloroflexota bacterium]